MSEKQKQHLSKEMASLNARATAKGDRCTGMHHLGSITVVGNLPSYFTVGSWSRFRSLGPVGGPPDFGRMSCRAVWDVHSPSLPFCMTTIGKGGQRHVRRIMPAAAPPHEEECQLLCREKGTCSCSNIEGASHGRACQAASEGCQILHILASSTAGGVPVSTSSHLAPGQRLL